MSHTRLLTLALPILAMIAACTPPEICDGLDNDMDGLIDEGLVTQADGVTACSALTSTYGNRFGHGEGAPPTPVGFGDPEDQYHNANANTPTWESTPSETEEPEPSEEETATPTFTAEPTPTFTAEPTPTFTAEPTPTFTAEPTPTFTAEPTPTFTAEPTPTVIAEPTDRPAPMVCEGLVTRGQGFWKNHPCVIDGDATGFPLVPIALGESTFLVDSEAISDYMASTPNSDSQLKMGKALTTAKLNLAAFDVGDYAFADWDGDGLYETVEELVAYADSLYDFGSSSKQKNMAEILQDFNEYGEELPLYFDETCSNDRESCDQVDNDDDGQVDEGCACAAQ